MPALCPKCGNGVGDGIERCPVCGARMHPRVMDEKTGFTWADFFNYTLYTLLILLGAVAIPGLIAFLCLRLILR